MNEKLVFIQSSRNSRLQKWGALLNVDLRCLRFLHMEIFPHRILLVACCFHKQQTSSFICHPPTQMRIFIFLFSWKITTTPNIIVHKVNLIKFFLIKYLRLDVCLFWNSFNFLLVVLYFRFYSWMLLRTATVLRSTHITLHHIKWQFDSLRIWDEDDANDKRIFHSWRNLHKSWWWFQQQ